MNDYESHFQKSCTIRNEFWSRLGKVHDNVISHMINPAFLGGPSWPSLRQAFLLIHTESSTIVASDGLSDPFEDRDKNPDNAPYNGFGLEFYAQMPGKVEMSSITAHPLFQIVYQMSQNAADHGNIAGLIDDHIYMTTELYDVNAPEAFLNDEDRVGVMLNTQDKQIPSSLELSLEPIKIVSVRLLTLNELSQVVEGGGTARMKLAKGFEKEAHPSCSPLSP